MEKVQMYFSDVSIPRNVMLHVSLRRTTFQLPDSQNVLLKYVGAVNNKDKYCTKSW
jgi:hypothetical protein